MGDLLIADLLSGDLLLLREEYSDKSLFLVGV